MDVQQIISQAENNIKRALVDYGRHTNRDTVVQKSSDKFISRLAKDSSIAKQGLRELFSKSPCWNKELDAIIINGTRTHDPNYSYIDHLGRSILRPVWDRNKQDFEDALELFTEPDLDRESLEKSVTAIKKLAPKAYHPQKKLSRVFRSMCTELGVVDESVGSEFQRQYANFADELSSKKIDFKLIVSINPAHFITMSNPKNDNRGSMLTSCQSLNSDEHSYTSGCAGYARDETSFIVFTVADEDNPESYNNRKTSRQVFAYKPGNGVLLQSRMYNTAGGIYGVSENSKLYRDLIQREISMLEDQPNLWKKYTYLDGEHHKCVETDDDFGGYADWIYSDFEGNVCIRNDCAQDHESILVGAYGLCVICTQETNSGVYCEDCKEYIDVCDNCEMYCANAVDVINEDYQEISVCHACLDNDWRRCNNCERYVHESLVEVVDDTWICDECLDMYYVKCGDCDEFCHQNDYTYIHTSLETYKTVCEYCRDQYYENCRECEYYIEIGDDGLCPVCGACIEEEEVC